MLFFCQLYPAVFVVSRPCVNCEEAQSCHLPCYLEQLSLWKWFVMVWVLLYVWGNRAPDCMLHVSSIHQFMPETVVMPIILVWPLPYPTKRTWSAPLNLALGVYDLWSASPALNCTIVVHFCLLAIIFQRLLVSEVDYLVCVGVYYSVCHERSHCLFICESYCVLWLIRLPCCWTSKLLYLFPL